MKKAFSRISLRGRPGKKQNKGGYYITDTFFRRECNKFVAKSTDEEDCCKCGYMFDEHSEHGKRWRHEPFSEWSVASDTVRLPTNAYGEIDFLNAENDVLPLYLRCDMEVDINELGTLFLSKWAMPLPNLLISVFGGHSKFDSKKMTAEMDIKEGLAKAARDTKAWLFTSGVNHGVSNLVGDAMAMKRSFVNSIPVIGINSWGAVNNNSELVEEQEQGLFPAKYTAVAQQCLERDPGTGKPKSMSLEHEHTHFVLMDFGTKNNFHENDQIRKFRVRLQKHLVDRTKAQLVSVLIEGGTGSLEEAKMRIREGLPVVVLGDSGRISNVLALAMDLSRQQEVCDGTATKTVRAFRNDDDRIRVREALSCAIPKLSSSKYDELMQDIEEIISNENLVTVWRCGKGIELDTCILQGLIKSIANGQPEIHDTAEEELREEQREQAKNLVKQQLELAIQWDRLDIANEYIFDNDNQHMDLHFTEDELNEMLDVAVKHKQTSFIRDIIERNANLKTFLTVERFEKILLENTPSNSLFYELMTGRSRNAEYMMTFNNFEGVIHRISEGVFKVPGLARPTDEIVEVPGNGMLLDSIRICGKGRKEYTNVSDPVDPKINYDFVDPASLLAVYYVLIHEQEMAKVFWEYSSTPLFLGLVNTCIHNWMRDQEKETLLISDAMAEKLNEYGREFEDISLALLEEVAEYQIEHVIALINFKFESWGGKTILEMADYVDAVNIIAHPTIQDYIDVEWNGWLDSDMSLPRLIVSCVCPALASFRDVTPFDKWKQKNLQTSRQKCRDSRQAFIDRGTVQDEGQQNEKLGMLTKMRYFYKAPITKFTIYTVVYMAFIFAYTCALLLRDRQDTSGHTEDGCGVRIIFGCRLTLSQTLVYIWVFCLVPLEIRQIYFSYPTTLMGKLKMYLASVYNKNDVLCISIILVALVCKITTPLDQEGPEGAGDNAFRLLFALAFVLYCLKLCQALQISEQLGPKVMMMHKMLIDLQFFIFLVLIFVIGYGVSTSSVMHPLKFLSFESAMMFDIFWRPYQNLFGEIGEETIDEVMNREYCLFLGEPGVDCDDYSCGDDENSGSCVFNIYIVKIMLGLYMMLAAVLMLNLLVAVFSSTYEEIRENSKTLWKRQKFDLMVEYRSRSPLPVPFSTILHCCRFIKFMFRLTCGQLFGCCAAQEDVHVVDVHQRLTVTLLEIECRRNYLEKLGEKSEHEELQDGLAKVQNDVEVIQMSLAEFESKIQQIIDVATGSKNSNRNSLEAGDDDDLSDMDIEEVASSADDLLQVTAEAAAVDMAMVQVQDAPDNHVTPKKDELSNTKPIDVARLLKMGKKSRKPDYPGEHNSVRRAIVKKGYWDWNRIWLNYSPYSYTDVTVPAEKKLPEIKWHCNVEGDERRSYEGAYEVRNQLPLIPCGRTGLTGRGLLDRYGPNHAALPIITRYAKDDKGDRVVLSDKPVLEVLLETRPGDVGSLPEIKGVYDDSLPAEIRGVLTDPANLAASESLSAEKIVRRIEKVFNAGILVYRGFLDSEYNTDNAWFEAIIASYHDTNDNTFHHVTFGETAKYKWSRVNNWTNINNMYREYLQKAFYARNGGS